MKRAIATSRCEVAGRVYLPGDDMTITEEQFTFLKQHNAVNEIVLQYSGPQLANATIEELDTAFARKLGKPVVKGAGKPNKESSNE